MPETKYEEREAIYTRTSASLGVDSYSDREWYSDSSLTIMLLQEFAWTGILL